MDIQTRLVHAGEERVDGAAVRRWRQMAALHYARKSGRGVVATVSKYDENFLP